MDTPTRFWRFTGLLSEWFWRFTGLPGDGFRDLRGYPVMSLEIYGVTR